MLALTQGLMTTGGNTASLLHMDGVNGSTSFADDAGPVWASAGNAQISTAHSVFGGASLLLDGVDDFIQSPWANRWSILGDFTVECFIRRTALGRDAIFTNYANQNSGFLFDIGQSDELRLILGTGSYILCTSGVTTVPTGSWVHVAGVKSGNTLRVFINGTQVGTLDVTGTVADATTTLVTIGRDPLDTNRDFGGHIDEFRFSRMARYTGNFVVPASPFVVD